MLMVVKDLPQLQLPFEIQVIFVWKVCCFVEGRRCDDFFSLFDYQGFLATDHQQLPSFPTRSDGRTHLRRQKAMIQRENQRKLRT